MNNLTRTTKFYMMMRYALLIALATGFLMTSCGSDDDTPECIDERLSTFRSEACATSGASLGGNLALFTFRSETVYCFNWGDCQPDKTIEIWQEDCQILCELSGPDNIIVCDGTPWQGNAVEESIIWQN